MTTLKYSAVIFVLTLSMVIGTSLHAGYYEDAYAAYQNKNYEESIKILNEGLQAAPNDEQLAMFAGQVYYKMKDFDKAAEMFQKTVQLAPELDKAQYYLGMCYTLKKEGSETKPAWFEASQAFGEAVKLKPDDFSYLYNYGHSLLMQKKYQQALEPLQKAYVTPDGAKDAKTITDLGLAFQMNKEKDKAVEMYEKAIELDPSQYSPIVYLGNLYMEKEEYEKIKSLGEKLISMKPDLGKGYEYRGIGQLRTKEFAAAEETFTKAIELDPKDGSAYFHRGVAREGKIGSGASSYSALIDDYSKAIAMNRDDTPSEWHYRLGHAYELEAMIYWERAVRHAESRSQCLKFLKKARESYQAAKDYPSAGSSLGGVNERIRQLEVIG